ncbi:prominin-2, partial [Anoplophora glabripennis]|uniref:prominin-2 n=1 Tax=Anoplophora glabripennis TaxID=217634 RepID=UPI0008759AED
FLFFNNIQHSVRNPSIFRGSALDSAQSSVTQPVPVPDKNRVVEFTNTSATRGSSLQFLDIPPGDDFRIHDLSLNEEYLLFEAFSQLMGYLQPTGFPSGLLRDMLYNRIPTQLLVFQVLKLEIVLIMWIVLWAMLSLCLPSAVAANFCCSNNIRRLEEDFSSGSTNSRDRWMGRTLGFLLHLLLLLLLCPIILILAGNEQISRSISRGPSSVSLIYEDVNTFIRNTHMQMSFVVTSSLDITIEAIRKDLEAVDVLLGKPYQQELSSETGIDIALLGLDDLKTSTSHLTSLVSDILSECASARIAGSMLQEQLVEISRQLTVARQQCSTKDRTLCYTLQHSGFDVAFSVDNITNDVKIRHLERFGTEEMFNASVEAARKAFAEVPDQVAMETSTHITEIKALLSRKRTEVYKSTHALDVLTTSLSEAMRTSEESVSTVIQRAADLDLWRWLSVLGVAAVLSLIWGLLLCGAPCGCGLTSRTIPFLLAGLGVSCVACLAVWGLGTLALVVGGHGEALVCRTLYEKPHFEMLSDLVDPGGVFFGNEGVFGMFRKGNDSVNVTDVLRNCQRNQPVYHTFHLYNKINVNTVTNHKEWDDMKLLFSNFTAQESNLEILGPSLQLNLQILSSLTSTNLTTHRTQLTTPITRRDLKSFADQLNTVSRQLSDPISSRKIDNLAFTVRRVINNELRKLVEIQNRMLYKITTLEVLLPPLHRQVNQTLSHLTAVQYFLDNESWQISERTRRRFISRIECYLEELSSHVGDKVTKEIGKCRPLWEIFHSARFYVCKLIVDPTNGIAFSSFFLILLFLTMAPVVIKLVEHYKEGNEDILTSISHRDSMMMEIAGTWATPSSSTPELPSRETAPSHAESPPTPTVTSPELGRLPQIPSISRAKSPRRGRNHESLRLVEPICWKSGSTTPKSWI